MNDFEFGKVLYKLYHKGIKLEEKNIKGDKNRFNLTINELNLIECIRGLTKGSEGPTISRIASELDITRPSTTVAVNKLEAKKFVEKTGCSNDGRSVRVKLSAKGEKAYSFHKSYNSALTKGLKEYFADDEFNTLTGLLEKLNTFYNERIEEAEEEEDY